MIDTKMIFVIDDEMVIREILRKHLSKKYAVIAFDKAVAAIDDIQGRFLLSKNIPWAILTDNTMPKKTGIELIRGLNKCDSPTIQQIRKILMTGDDITPALIKELKLDGFLKKPFRLPELDKVLEKIYIT